MLARNLKVHWIDRWSSFPPPYHNSVVGHSKLALYPLMQDHPWYDDQTQRGHFNELPRCTMSIYIYKTSWSLEQMHACLCGLHHDQQTLLHFTTQSRRVVALHVLHWSIRYMNVYYINYLIVLMLWLTYLFFAEYVWVCQRVSLNPGLFFSSLKTPFGAINLLFSDT